MTTSLFNISTYSRYTLDDDKSDISVLVREYKERIKLQLARNEENLKNNFISFAEKKLSVAEVTWLQDNEERFFVGTPNERILQLDYLSALGYIFCMLYSPDGEHIIVGFSSGLIQVGKNSGSLIFFYPLKAVCPGILLSQKLRTAF